MATMGVRVGVDGVAKINGTSVRVTSWSFKSALKSVETTAVGDASEQHENTGVDGATGNLTMVFDNTNDEQALIVNKMLASDIKDKILLELYYDASNELKFSAVITGIDLPAKANDMTVMAVDWVKTGPLNEVPIPAGA